MSAITKDSISAGKAKIKSEFVVRSAPAYKRGNPETLDAPAPKKERRGQNKHRPGRKKNKIEDCLCPSLVSDEGVCTFGKDCRFIHDVNEYMLRKPKDIGPECHAYSTHGKCNFGFACRYASSHLSKDEEGNYVNDVEEALVAKSPHPKISNTISRNLVHILRKKEYKFTKTESVLNDLGIRDNKPSSNKSRARPGSEQTGNGTAAVPNGGSVLYDLGIPDHEPGGDKNMKSPGPEQVETVTASVPTAGDLATCGVVTNADQITIRDNEKKSIKFAGKLYLAPLTTVGNLPFRVTCKGLGADVTCGEMTMATALLQGNVSEWALLKRHPCEDVFGAQICGGFPDTMAKCAELIDANCTVDFIDINMGCPIDLVYNKGCGSALMRRTNKLYDIVKSVNSVLTIPLTCKMRTGIDSKHNIAHNILPRLRDYGVSLCSLHGRSRQARYTKQADWDYIEECAKSAAPMPLFGNGDVLSFEDYNAALAKENISGVMIARGALIKPWIFTEIKEQRHWDISSSERMAILKKFVNTGLLHWGSDTRGVETTRRFLLEWLSFLHRYIPVGILEKVPQKINEQPAPYVGRDDLETLMASHNCKSWIKISEMLLGKVPEDFQFLPKHKANSYN